MHRLPLAGVKVLELGQLIGGPFAAKLLGDIGADRIKIEPPGTGDLLRAGGLMHRGTSLWWYVQSRNERSLTLNVRVLERQEVVKRLARGVDVLMENFRPEALEGWGLGWEVLDDPALLLLRSSGYGQWGLYKERAGFWDIGEAVGGLRYLTGEPGRAPVRTGISTGDSLVALLGVIGVPRALYHRDRNQGEGQMVDVALYEDVFSMMEELQPEYDLFGVIRQTGGSSLPAIAPSNAYPCRDSGFAVIAENGDGMFRRLIRSIGREDLAYDPQSGDNEGRVARQAEIAEAITSWTRTRGMAVVLELLREAGVPADRIYTAADIARDVHYRTRDMIVPMVLSDGTIVDGPGVVLKLSATPAQIRSSAPELGQHSDSILDSIGLDAVIGNAWRAGGII